LFFLGKIFRKKSGSNPKIEKMTRVFERLLTLLNDDNKQNALMPSFLQKIYFLDNMIDQRLANDQDLGYTKEKPIPVNGPLGELTYLSRLVVKETGSRVFFHRLGSLKVVPDKNVDVYELLSWDGKNWDILYFNCYYRTKINAAPLKYTFAQQVEGLTGVNITLPLFPNGIYEATQQNAERIINKW
jgi:hypothetical protein